MAAWQWAPGDKLQQDADARDEGRASSERERDGGDLELCYALVRGHVCLCVRPVLYLCLTHEDNSTLTRG